MKLFWKLFCSMVSVTILACSIGGFLFIDGQFRASLEREVEALYEENDMLRYALSREAEGQLLTKQGALSKLADSVTLTTGGQTVSFELCNASGEKLGGNCSLPITTGWLISGLSENQRGWCLHEISDGRHILSMASALTLGDETLYLVNGRNVRALYTQRSAQYWSFLGVMLVLIAVTVALSLLVSHLILRPLGRVSDAARRMAGGELDQRVPVTSDDELGQLSADFNAMADQLEQQMLELADAAQRQKDFTGSFAHEIKTPLTSIIGYADLLLSRPMSPEQVRDSAGYIFREGKRLEALSGKLMELIVLDRQDFPKRHVSMGAFLEQMGSTMHPALEQAGIQLTVEAEEAPFFVEPDLLTMVGLNLLDNARKATPGGGKFSSLGRSKKPATSFR